MSGAATLIYEIVWIRWLVYLFGVTYHAITTVVTVFMLGLALGALVAGRLADRVRSPLKAYAALEGLVALCGVLFPFALHGVSALYLRHHDAIDASFGWHIAVRFVLACLLMLVPTVAMGATLPVLARGFVRGREQLGVDLGRLYGLNTLGALVGCMASGLWLISSFGLQASNALAVVLNLGAAGAALLLVRQQARAPVAPSSSPAPTSPPPAAAPTGSGSPWLLLVFFASGFAVVAYELLWTRVVVLTHPNSHTAAFSTVLGLLLLGTALGSMSWGRRVAARADPHRVYGGLLVVSGLVSAAVPFVWQGLRDRAGGAWFEPPTAITAVLDVFITPTQLVLLAVAMGVPAFCAGLAFPVGNRLYVRRVSLLGTDVGAVYFFSTVGGIAGSFTTGFWLMPALGLVGTLFLVSAVSVATGMLVWAARARAWPGRAGLVGAGLAAGAAVWFVGRQLPIWMFVNLPGDFEVAFYRDGRSTTDAGIVTIDPEGRRSNELYSTGEVILPIYYAAWAPIALAGSPREVLVQAFDTGTMSAMAVSMPRVEHVTSVDISDVQGLIAEHFATANRRVFTNPRFELVVNDARNHLSTREGAYDVIFHGVAFYASYQQLATVEYFEQARRSLRPGGIYAHKLHPDVVDDEAWWRVTAGFCEVFPTVWLWQAEAAGIHLLLGFRDETPPMDWATLEADWPARTRESLAPPGGLEAFAGTLDVHGEDLCAEAAAHPAIHDDRPPRVTDILGHLFADDSREPELDPVTQAPMLPPHVRDLRDWLDTNRSPLSDFFTGVPPEAERRVDQERARIRESWTPKPPPPMDGGPLPGPAAP